MTAAAEYNALSGFHLIRGHNGDGRIDFQNSWPGERDLIELERADAL
jgi:hypothetical protein